ncbi:MAG: hypothetical protein VSS52_003625 [Thiotrichaceae bacterium]|nr:hypothetical protein [Thiotrichaceae bacterium]
MRYILPFLLFFVFTKAYAAPFEMDLSSYEVGDVPNALGEHVIIKEKDGLCVTGHSNAQNASSRLLFDNLNLSGNFEVIINIDFNGDNTYHLFLQSKVAEIAFHHYDDYLQLGGINEKISWEETNWEGGDVVNTFRFSVKSNVAKLYINDVFFQTLVLDNPSAVYTNLEIVGIDEDDYVCGVRGANLSDDPETVPQLSDYEKGVQAGKQECINNPQSCGISVADNNTTCTTTDNVEVTGKANASYEPTTGHLHIPFLDIQDLFGGITTYQVDFQQKNSTLDFTVDTESIKAVVE